MGVSCAEATATYGAGDGAARKVERLELRGDVTFTRRDGLTAKAATAEWDETSGQLVLTGAPEVVRGRDLLRGRRIVVGVRDDTLEVDEPRLSAPRGRPVRTGEVRAARMTLGPGGRTARFERDVQLTDGSLAARSDLLVAALVPEAPGRPADLSAVTLTGRVVATRGTQRAEAGEARWSAVGGELVLTNRPMLSDGGDVVRGSRIVFDRERGAARVEAAVARVRAP
jgi:lipopolysaccharide export system protein LptA